MEQDVTAETVIEIRELRIGNILSYKGEYVHVTNLSCDIDDEYTDLIGFCKIGETTNEKCDWNRALFQDLERVKLTTEILKRIGFVVKGESLVLEIGDYLYLSTIKSGSGVKVFTNSEHQTGSSIEYLYLHEIQNIHYLLAGQELILKP